MTKILSICDYLLIIHISNEEDAISYFETHLKIAPITKFGSSYQFS